MRAILLLLAGLLLSGTVFAEHLSLDQLLKEIQKTQGVEGKINREREARFLADHAKQQELFQAAKNELAAQERLSKQLKDQMMANEQALDQLQAELDNRSGILRELTGVAKQAAGDLKADLEGSIVSAQFPERTGKLATMTQSKALPTLDELETLWFYLLQEMTESGKVVKFNSNILTASGEPRQAEVVRVGVFNAIADGNYLRYLSETGKLAELARQPGGDYNNLAEKFVSQESGTADLGVDPTRGVILSMLIHAPDSFERIQQGGAIGYIILVLGAFGLIYGLYRLFLLTQINAKVTEQITSDKVAEDNPLGRIIAAAEQNQAQNTETLELVLDEAITREVPVLEKGLSMIKLLAAVAPLLGLLGTVTGMIATFQSISLFGTGDPKLMASGISQALVTTMLGLCAAVPLLFLHSLLAYRSRALIQILDEQSAGIISRRAGK